MKRLFSIVWLWLGIFLPLFAGEMECKTDFRDIPIYSLAKTNHTVELTENYEIIYSEEVTVTVLHAEGLAHAHIVIPYDDLTTITHFSATIRNPVTGKVVQKLKLKDLHDRSWIANFSIFEDNRLKYFTVHSGAFPLEVSYQFSTKTHGNFNIPSWRPAPHAHQKVMEAKLTVSYPEAIGIRYLPINLLSTPAQRDSLAKTLLIWQENSMQPYAPDLGEEQKPILRLAPLKFSMEGFASTMEDWQGLGKWINLLNRDKEELPQEAKLVVANLSSGLERDEEKIKVLYRYLQDNYRYVSIQLGIGGWMPMAARDVYRLKYGDCKALTMLMKALLQEAGIASHYSLIKAGQNEKDINTDFPSNQFNHVILQVPMADTLWLECTSRTLPAGFLGQFTMDRTALVINEQGGYLTPTPDYKSSKFNQIQSKSAIRLLEYGAAELTQKIEWKGFGAVPFIQIKTQKDQAETQKALYNHLATRGGLYMDSYELEVSATEIPTAHLSHQSHLERFYQSTAKRIMITPYLRRLTQSDIPNGHLWLEETLEIKTTGGLEAEALNPINLQEDHFDYNKQIHFENDTLTIYRTIKLHFVEDASESAISQTLERLHKLDQQPLLLKKIN
ncbi:MAG TPA: DUF3857 domain-containing protein [Cyclobacteriaceae bacterium]|nr:DUF3857 domain-containing protein [Cyclobacteriaceae bacterium]